MIDWLLNLDLTSGPVPWTIWITTGVLALALLARRPRRRRIVRVVLATVIGFVAGYLLATVLDVSHAFGDALPAAVRWWTAAGCALWGLAVASLWDSRWWQKATAILLIVASALMTAIGINAAFGLDRTAAEILGLPDHPVAEGFAPPVPVSSPEPPLWQAWNPPADMPAKTQVLALAGDAAIPSSAGFVPRDATIYLPPAAQVADPPALPVVVQMMGLPGAPESSAVQSELDAFAAKHHGLAPIVIIADQLGSQTQNPACADTKAYGGVSTYFNVDIPAYIRSHLRVLPGPQYWTISGYSNGGACSFLYAAEHPEIWGNLIDISGEQWPGFADPEGVLGGAFAGDQAAFEANKPENVLLASPGRYDDSWAVFTAGALDAKYGACATAAAAAATAAGFTVRQHAIAGADHVGPALTTGLSLAFADLATRWGLQE